MTPPTPQKNTANVVKNTACSPTNTTKTYVDDNIALTKPKPGQSLKEALLNTIKKIEYYTNSNMLALDPDKSKVMVMTTKKLKRKLQYTNWTKGNYTSTIVTSPRKPNYRLFELGSPC